MPRKYSPISVFEISICVAIIATILLFQGCQNRPETENFDNLTVPQPRTAADLFETSDNSSFACIEVEGTVLGDLIPGSNVTLFKTSNVNHSTVMREIRVRKPLDSVAVNFTKGFVFDCVFPGIYAFVIPSSSYNGSVGFPLPYEFDCRNVSLDIAFQGGDSENAVGVFSITNSSAQNKITCYGGMEFCRPDKGPLYRKCLPESRDTGLSRPGLSE